MLVYPWYLCVIRTWRQVDSTKFSEVFLLKFYNIPVDLTAVLYWEHEDKEGRFDNTKICKHLSVRKKKVLWSCYSMLRPGPKKIATRLYCPMAQLGSSTLSEHCLHSDNTVFCVLVSPKAAATIQYCANQTTKTDIWKVFRTQTPQDFQSSCFYWGLQCFWSIFWAYWVMYHTLAVLAASEHRNVVLPL